MTFQEAMKEQSKKLQLYLDNGGVNGIPRKQDASRPCNPVDTNNGLDASCDNHSSQSEILTDIAKAILLRED